MRFQPGNLGRVSKVKPSRAAAKIAEKAKSNAEWALGKAFKALTEPAYRDRHNVCVVAGAKLLKDLSKHVVFRDVFLDKDSKKAVILEEDVFQTALRKKGHVEEATAATVTGAEPADPSPTGRQFRRDKSFGEVEELTEKEKRSLKAGLDATPSKTIGGALQLN